MLCAPVNFKDAEKVAHDVIGALSLKLVPVECWVNYFLPSLAAAMLAYWPDCFLPSLAAAVLAYWPNYFMPNLATAVLAYWPAFCLALPLLC